jgi:hypothetical protein
MARNKETPLWVKTTFEQVHGEPPTIRNGGKPIPEPEKGSSFGQGWRNASEAWRQKWGEDVSHYVHGELNKLRGPINPPQVPQESQAETRARIENQKRQPGRVRQVAGYLGGMVFDWAKNRQRGSGTTQIPEQTSGQAGKTKPTIIDSTWSDPVKKP